jgi:hypothetical protein
MLVLDDPNSRKEDEVYRELAAGWKAIAQLVVTTAARMAAQHELPWEPTTRRHGAIRT